MNRTRTFGWIALVFAALVLSARLVAPSPTLAPSPSPTAHVWQALVDSRSSFRIKYPPSWTVTETPDSYLFDLGTQTRVGAVIIRIYDGQFSTTVDNWVQTNFGDDLEFPFVKISRLMNQQGYPVVQVVGLPGETSDSKTSVFKNGNFVVVLSVAPYTRFASEYDSMVNSLTFY